MLFTSIYSFNKDMHITLTCMNCTLRDTLNISRPFAYLTVKCTKKNDLAKDGSLYALGLSYRHQLDVNCYSLINVVLVSSYVCQQLRAQDSSQVS